MKGGEDDIVIYLFQFFFFLWRGVLFGPCSLLSAIFQSLRKPSINNMNTMKLDETSKAQAMALVRHYISTKQGTRILVNPHTQEVRESHRKLSGTQHHIVVLSITHINGHFRWLPGRRQDLRDMRALAFTCKQYPCF